jgi:cyclase
MEGLRLMGAPAALARSYYDGGADELLYMDIVASLYGRSIDLDLVKAVAAELFIPLTVGGGIQSLHDISAVLRSGADKVAINTCALRKPSLLEEAVKQFGAQCIVLSIEAKRLPSGSWEAYAEGGREHSGRDVVEWVKQALALGVGEVLVSSVDRDGTRGGYDMDLIRAVAAVSSVPVIAHGGAGTKESVLEAVTVGGADAVSCGTAFHYRDYSIRDLKAYLADHGVSVRL